MTLLNLWVLLGELFDWKLSMKFHFLKISPILLQPLVATSSAILFILPYDYVCIRTDRIFHILEYLLACLFMFYNDDFVQ